MAYNITLIESSPRRCKPAESDWKAAAATVVAGAACYAGYKIVQKQLEGKDLLPRLGSPSVPLEQCAICWEKMKPRKHFSCSHSFHDACIQNHQQQDKTQLVCVDKKGKPIYPTCPICKAEQVARSEKDWEMVDEFDL